MTFTAGAVAICCATLAPVLPGAPGASQPVTHPAPQVARPTDSDVRAQFLAIEQIARKSQTEQRYELARLYKELAPRYMNPFVEGLISSPRTHILDDKAYGMPGGNATELWAQQLADAADDLTPEQVADSLKIGLWLNVAARARALQVMRKHPDHMRALLRADLQSDEKEAIAHASKTALSLQWSSLTVPLLEIFIHNPDAPQDVFHSLLFMRDPAIVEPLLKEVSKDPAIVTRCGGLFQGPLHRQSAPAVLLQLLNSSDEEIQFHALSALLECFDPRLATAAARFATHLEPRFRRSAAYMTGHLPHPVFLAQRDRLLPLLDDKNEQVRFAALRAFARHKDRAAAELVLALLQQPEAPKGHTVVVMQAMSKLADSTFNYDMHQWGPEKDRNKWAIQRFQDWLDTIDPNVTTVGEVDQPLEIAWGTVVNGLRAGIITMNGGRALSIGDEVVLKFLVQNTTDQPISLAYDRSPVFINWSNYRNPPGPQLLDAKGKQVFPAAGVGGRGLPGQVIRTIPPGKEVCLTTCRLPLRTAPWRGTTVNALAYCPEPGEHSVSLSYSFNNANGKHWQGTVTTGPLELELHASADQDYPPSGNWGLRDGIYCRLTARTPQWNASEAGILVVDLLNRGDRTVQQCWHSLEFKLEIDGQWTGKLSPTEVSGPEQHLTPGDEWINVPLVLEDNHYFMSAAGPFSAGTAQLSKLLGPGRHAIRIDVDGVVSNSIEIEVTERQ